MIHLMNTAMMPTPGKYEYARISQEEFAKVLQDCGGQYRSYVGYPQTAEHVLKVSGVNPPISRDQTVLEDGDVMLIVKLSYRVADPRTKGQPQDEDWEYGLARYSRP